MARLIALFPLRRGSHPTREHGMCAMEMVAWLAGEPHSDEPACTCPVLAALVRAANDALPSDAARGRWLRPLVPQLIGTHRAAAITRRRAFAVVDAAVRRFAPLRLGRVGRAGAAQALRALPPVRDAGSAVTALLAVRRHAPELRPLLWLLERARDGELAPHHLGSAVMLLRPVGDAAAWAQLVALLRLLLAIDRPASVDRRP
ncbi:MAG TPA: hypothetical protein VK348_02850 [Planctomycetota bacterium]|nr:hypothetical protein [Planctomycetota bacterium]